MGLGPFQLYGRVPRAKLKTNIELERAPKCMVFIGICVLGSGISNLVYTRWALLA